MPTLNDLYKHETMPEAFDCLGEKDDKSFEQTKQYSSLREKWE